jgi:hypothetical protein
MGWATIVERGCGQRVASGIYAECGLGRGGRPLEDFLVDSPLPLPDGLDRRGLANKAQVWEDPRSGVSHLVIWIGAEHYPYVADYVEEVRRYGASRRVGSMVDVSKLTPGASRMILVHPLARVVNWADMAKPADCDKRVPGHAGMLRGAEVLVAARHLLEDGRTVDAAPPPPLTWEEKLARVASMATEDLEELARRDAAGEAVTLEAAPPPAPVHHVDDAGPCLFKTWELIPPAAGEYVMDEDGGRKLYTRTLASTTYAYAPTGEDRHASFEPGIFAALPLHGFALIRDRDGTMDERRASKLDASGMPWYAADK